MGTTPTNSDSSGAQVTNQINSVARDVQALQTTQIFKDDTGTRRVLLGKGADDFYGLKVSQSGVDVYAAGDADLVFNSNQNVFKIVASGTAIMPAAAITASPFWSQTSQVSVTHSLGYAPVILAFYDSGTTYEPFVTGTQLAVTGISGSNITISSLRQTTVTSTTTSANFQITYIDTGGNSYNSFNIKYYLLQETAN
jgi:hypothetical protein